MPKLCGTEKRKQRKANRRKKDRRSLKERRLNHRDLDSICWEIALVMTRKKVKGVNLKHYCDICSQFYCQGFDGVQVFCRTCYYKDCCQKLSINYEDCDYCRKGELCI